MKFNKLFIAILATSLLAGCNKKQNSDTSSLEASSIANSESLSNSGEESNDSSSTSKEFEFKIGKTYKFNSWNQDVNKMLTSVVGDKADTVPVFIAPSYEASVDYIAISETQETLAFTISCFGVNSSSSERLYTEKMEENGYTITQSQGVRYGYQMVDYTKDIFVGYQLTSDATPSFVIQARVQVTREDKWNKEFVNMYSDIEFPAFNDAKAYSMSYSSSDDRLMIYALFTAKTAQSDYQSALRLKGFSVKATDSTGATQMVDSTGYVTVTLYQTYGDYNCDALYIVISNAWPAIGIASFTGAGNFPKLTSNTASYDGYTYVDTVGEGNDKDYALCIYYVNASATDYGNYITTFTTYGFTKGETTTSDTGILMTNLTCKVNNKYDINLKLLYKTSTSEICLVIYQSNY